MIHINKKNFLQAHSAFLKHMKKKGNGVPFTNFRHGFFLADEIADKVTALREGKKLVCFEKWPGWQKKTGRIVEAMQSACKQSVSKNLLEHKYGNEKNSYSALYRLKSPELVRAFEAHVVTLYSQIDSTDAAVGAAFDDIAGFLREHRLGCKWDFLAYFMFLMRHERFFPIRSTHIERVLNFYGVECRLTKQVSWDHYKLILNVGDAVREELCAYGSPSAIELQSYLWVVSYLLPKLGDDNDGEGETDVDFDEELRKRQQREGERQRIGLLGEQYVFVREKASLVAAGEKELAEQVRLISADDNQAGYDVLSFTCKGEEKHIEVKSTSRFKEEYDRFWLSDNEVRKGSSDPHWTVYRVWGADSDAHSEELGNIITSESAHWAREASSWIVRKTGQKEKS